MVLQRITHSGAAPPTNLLSAITATAMSFGLTSSTGYPTGSGGPFVIDIDAGLPTEEKVLCSSLSGGTITVAPGGRGWDSTIAVAHTPGTVLAPNVTHIFSSNEADDANAHIYVPTRNDHTQYALAKGVQQPATAINIGLPTTSGNILVGPAGPGMFIVSGHLRCNAACTVTIDMTTTDESGNIFFYLLALAQGASTPVGLNAASLAATSYAIPALGVRNGSTSNAPLVNGFCSSPNTAWLSLAIQQLGTV